MASLTADEAFRHEKEAFDASVDAQGPEPIIHTLLTAIPGLKLYTRLSPRYEALRGVFNKLIKAQPLVICRPTSVSQICAIVCVAGEQKVPLCVRCGGHDVWGRGCIADSITIDMREMDSQTLAEDKQTVRIGGGVTSRNFVGFLDTHGLCTANGTAGNVGWTGWAVWGGYGPFNDYVGLGLDNIVAAKMVTANGELVDADAELLWGIRGAGGNLGVIVETTVRVYPMANILAGFIVYAWEEADKVLLALQDLVDKGVPDALGGQMGLMKTKWGVGMSLIYAWPDPDLAEGKKWLEVVRGLGKVTVDTVTESTPRPPKTLFCLFSLQFHLFLQTEAANKMYISATFKTFQSTTSRPVDLPVNVYTCCVSIPRFTSSTVAPLIKYANRIPDVRQYNVIAHIGHGKLTHRNPSSCFGTRQPHVLFHINASDEAERMADAEDWVEGLVGELKATGETMKPVYVNFMGEDERTEESFGENWEKLRTLKKMVDKDNMFRFSQPRIL